MKRIPAELATAIIALLGLALGVLIVAGPGWALIVASALVLVYVILPDQRPAA